MPPLSIMVKPASSNCNLRCEYCFYSDVASKREFPNFGIMSEKTARKLIISALEFADGESISFAFQGGEPVLAGLDYFKSFTAFAKENNPKNSKIFYSLQTNGTLLNDEFANFFRENEFLIGLSLDGDFENNSFRKDANGQNSYYKIIRAADILKRYGVEFNILTVLTGRCADNCEKIYRHFRSKGYKYLQFIPCLRPFESEEESELYMTAEQYANFLIRTFNLYVKDFVRGNYVSIRQFDNLVRMYLGENPEQCGMCGHCTHQFVAEGNGNIYPCDFYCTDRYLLGNICDTSLEKMANSEKAKDFIRESLQIPDKCRRCRFFALCRAGGCKRQRADRDYCESYQKFFSSCLPLFRAFDKG